MNEVTLGIIVGALAILVLVFLGGAIVVGYRLASELSQMRQLLGSSQLLTSTDVGASLKAIPQLARSNKRLSENMTRFESTLRVFNELLFKGARTAEAPAPGAVESGEFYPFSDQEAAAREDEAELRRRGTPVTETGPPQPPQHAVLADAEPEKPAPAPIPPAPETVPTETVPT